MTPPPEFTLSRDGLPCRIQRRLGLMPEGGYGLGRRIVVALLVTWVPVVAWALLTGRAGSAAPDDALLHHFGVHVRCLVAIPLLLLAEPLVDARWGQVLGHFRESGLVSGEARSGFDHALDRARRLRDSPVVLLALVAFIALEVVGIVSLGGDDLTHEVLWAREQTEDLGFGGWWYLTISRPVFTLLLGLWLWRGLVALRLLRKLARLPLQIVPMHPDRAGGLGVLAELVPAAAPVTLAISAVIAARLAHTTAYHGVAVTSLKPVLIVLVAVLALAVVLPLLFFSPRLARVRRQAVFDYSGLLARHGHLVDRRWIKQEDVGKPTLLDAPELGPVADINTMYDAVARMSPMVARPKVLIQAALPPALPIIPLLATQVPLADILRKLLHLLM